MKKRMKQLFTGLMVMALLVGMIPATAQQTFAEETPAKASSIDTTVETGKESVKAEQDIGQAAQTTTPSKKSPGISTASAGDVILTSFTIANSATAGQSASGTTYNTYTTNVNQLTLRGTYQLDKDASDALVSVTLTNLDIENYFGGDGKYNYFTTVNNNIVWPVGSANHSITQDTNGVTVSFTVSGSKDASGSFAIGYSFDTDNFGGWIPNGKSLAEITTGGDIVSNNMRTVTAAVVDNTGFSFTKQQATEEVGIDQKLTFEQRNLLYGTQWKKQPNTPLTMYLEYPDGTVVTVPTKAAHGGPVSAPLTETTGKTLWDFGQITENGAPEIGKYFSMADEKPYNAYLYYYMDKTISAVFPSSEFEVGDQVAIKATIEYTLAGQTTPTKKETTFNYTIIDNIIHISPFDLKLNSNGHPQVDIDNGNDRSNNTINNLMNGGTAPVPNTKLIWYNDVKDTGNKANPTAFTIYNIGASFSTDCIYYIKHVNGTSRQVQYKAASVAPGAANTVSNTKAGVSLAAGEYIDKVELYPLDSSGGSEVRALPVSAGIKINMGYDQWIGGTFPDGRTINHGDITVTDVEAVWEQESKPELHVSGTVVDKTNTGTGTTVTMRNASTDVHRNLYWVRKNIWPNVSFAYQTGQAGAKLPGTTVGINVVFGQNFNMLTNWTNPIIYYIPPDYLEVDEDQSLSVTTNTGAAVAGTDVTLEKITLQGKTAYKIIVDGLTTSATTTYNIPLTLKVKEGTLPGTYSMHNTNGSQGLLFGTQDDPFNILYYEELDKSKLYTDSDNLDGNADTSHLITANSPTLTVSAVSRMDVAAEMYNDDDEEWQSVYDPGAQATVSTNAGGQGQFSLTVKNGGNSYLGDIRLLDILPFNDPANEKTVLNPTAAKGSEWTATLKKALEITIYDGGGNDKTSDFAGAYQLQYSTVGNPTYNGGAAGTTIQRTGNASFSNNGTYETAKSFLFNWNSSTLRLPPGYKVVITGTVKSPTGVTAADNNKLAYNAFAVQGQFFTAATGGTGTPASLSEPTKQKFILQDISDAQINKEGFAFKDFNNNGRYDVGVDEKYKDITAELWKADATGKPAGSSAVASTTTDADGMYAFDGLLAGDYVIKFIKPGAVGYEPYAFVAKGNSSSNTDSHVDNSGVSDKFTLTASTTINGTTNAGIKAAGQITVKYYTKSGDTKTYVGTDLTKSVPMTGNTVSISATAGSTDYPLPTGYYVVSTDTVTKDGNLTWNAAAKTFEFEISNLYTVVPSAGGHGAISPNPTQTVTYDSSKSFTMTPEAGYEIDTVTVQRGTAAAQTVTPTIGANDVGTYDLANIKTNTTIHVTFKEKANVIISYTSEDTDKGTVSNTSESVAPATGTTVGSTATPVKGYRFVGWKKQGETATLGTDTTFKPGKTSGAYVAATYIAYFEENSDVTINYVSENTDKGTVSLASESIAPVSGTATGSTATAAKGYEVSHWTNSHGDIVKPAAPDQTTDTYVPTQTGGAYDADTYTAHFIEKDNVAIIYQSGDLTMGTVSRAAESLAPATGTAQGSTAEPLDGYEFVSWTDSSNQVVSTSAAFVPEKDGDGLNAAGTYTANFKIKEYSVSFDTNGGNPAKIPSIKVTYKGNIMSSIGFPAADAVTRADDKRYRYTFIGWKIVSARDLTPGEMLKATDTMPAGDVALIANWEATNIGKINGKDDLKNLSVVKKADQSSVIAGTNTSYTILVTNKGTTRIEDVTIKDPLPNDTTYVSSTQGGIYKKGGTAGTVTWKIASLEPKQTVKLKVTLKTNEDIADGYLLKNTAIYQTKNGTGGEDPQSYSNTTSTRITDRAAVQTGDTANTSFYVALAIAAALLAVILILPYRRRKKMEE